MKQTETSVSWLYPNGREEPVLTLQEKAKAFCAFAIEVGKMVLPDIGKMFLQGALLVGGTSLFAWAYLLFLIWLSSWMI